MLVKPSDILTFRTVIAELLLVPFLPIRHRAWNKHRFGQWVVINNVGTDMKGRNFSLAVSLTSSHLASLCISVETGEQWQACLVIS